MILNRISKFMAQPPFEPRNDHPSQRLSVKSIDRPYENRMPCELEVIGEKHSDCMQKTTVESDDGLAWKDSRGDKTTIELFIAGIRGWEAGPRWVLSGNSKGGHRS